jgi:hypothetical protein
MKSRTPRDRNRSPLSRAITSTKFVPETTLKEEAQMKSSTKRRISLAPSLRARLNRSAHALAVQFEFKVRSELLKRVEMELANGATDDDLCRLIDELELPATGMTLKS